MEDNSVVPILFPLAPEIFWNRIRLIIQEEISKLNVKTKSDEALNFNTPGLTYKPLFKMAEVCAIFTVSRPTIYEWIKHGKLRPYKIRSRVYFLWNDIQQLLGNTNIGPLH